MDPRRLLPALGAVAAACLVATLVVTVARPGERADGASRPAAAAKVPPGPAAILATWDRERSSAWAEGDAEALRRLYADGSRTGTADLRLLRHYLDRGLTVEGLRTQVLALRVVARSTSRLVLVVTDRVVGGRAVGRGASSPIALPADRASTRRIVLVRGGEGEGWLVAEARDQASAAASTSRTSSSSKS